MKPFAEGAGWSIYLGDNREVLAGFDADSIDAQVSDPPYGLSREPDAAEVLRHWLAGDDYAHTGGGFMGKGWDSFVPGPVTWRAVRRVLKPGAPLLAFAGTRTYGLTEMALRLAEFEVRDMICYIHAQGFPKSLDVSKALDKAAGAEREVVGRSPFDSRKPNGSGGVHSVGLSATPGGGAITAPATDLAREWAGYGTALKPAIEPCALARKPLDGTVAENVTRWGTGALNIDGCRVEGAPPSVPQPDFRQVNGRATHLDAHARNGEMSHATGRWPSNLLLSHGPGCRRVGERKVKGSAPASGPTLTGASNSVARGRFNGVSATPCHADPDGTETVPAYECEPGCPVAELDRQSGTASPKAARTARKGGNGGTLGAFAGSSADAIGTWPEDPGGGASRFYATFEPDAVPFFYTAKASKRERGPGNVHPTVKPIALMRYLVRLVSRPGALILDPFTGSGSTGVAAILEGRRFVGIEMSEEYAEIAARRLMEAERELRLIERWKSSSLFGGGASPCP